MYARTKPGMELQEDIVTKGKHTHTHTQQEKCRNNKIMLCSLTLLNETI